MGPQVPLITEQNQINFLPPRNLVQNLSQHISSNEANATETHTPAVPLEARHKDFVSTTRRKSVVSQILHHPKKFKNIKLANLQSQVFLMKKIKLNANKNHLLDDIKSNEELTPISDLEKYQLLFLINLAPTADIKMRLINHFNVPVTDIPKFKLERAIKLATLMVKQSNWEDEPDDIEIQDPVEDFI